MSSSVSLKWDKPIILEAWSSFCEANGIEYSQCTVGGNVFYSGGHGGVEIWFGESALKDFWQDNSPPPAAKTITVKTFWMGDLGAVARVAKAILGKWPGQSTEDPELSKLMAIS